MNDVAARANTYVTNHRRIPVNSFRVPSLILGILGSVGALLISGIFFLVYLLITLSNMFEKVPSPNSNPPIGLTIQIFYYFAVGVLGISGARVSSSKPRSGGAILLVAAIAVLIPLSPLFAGPIAFSVLSLLSLGSPALLFSAGLLTLIEKRTKRPERPVAPDPPEKSLNTSILRNLLLRL